MKNWPLKVCTFFVLLFDDYINLRIRSLILTSIFMIVCSFELLELKKTGFPQIQSFKSVYFSCFTTHDFNKLSDYISIHSQIGSFHCYPSDGNIGKLEQFLDKKNLLDIDGYWLENRNAFIAVSLSCGPNKFKLYNYNMYDYLRGEKNRYYSGLLLCFLYMTVVITLHIKKKKGIKKKG